METTINAELLGLPNGETIDLSDRKAVLTLMLTGDAVSVAFVFAAWRANYETAKETFAKTPIVAEYQKALDAVMAEFAKTEIAKRYNAALSARDESKAKHDGTLRLLQKELRPGEFDTLETIEQRGKKA